MMPSDLTGAEQTRVRAALRFLRARCGGWANLAKILGFAEDTLGKVANERKPATPVLAFRIASSTGSPTLRRPFSSARDVSALRALRWRNDFRSSVRRPKQNVASALSSVLPATAPTARAAWPNPMTRGST